MGKGIWSFFALFFLTLCLTGCMAKRAYNQGVKWSEQGQYGKAIISYRKATQARSNFYSAHFNTAKCYEKLSLQEKALASYEQAVHAAPEKLEGYWNMALLLEELERWEEALPIWQQALVLCQTDWDLRQARRHIDTIQTYLAVSKESQGKKETEVPISVEPLTETPEE